MPLRMHITKATAQNETVVVDVCQWNPVTGEVLHDLDEMNEMANEALKVADLRLLDMHTKMLEAESLEEYCTTEEWSKIISILDILSGRQTVDLVKRRWHSAREETADLEAARLAASKERIVMCAECLADEPISKMTAPDPEYPEIYICQGCLTFEKEREEKGLDK
jgi:hypothetical protein